MSYSATIKLIFRIAFVLFCALLVSGNDLKFKHLEEPWSIVNRQTSNQKVVRNVGTNLVPPGTSPKRYSGNIASPYPGIPSFFFKSRVEGSSFSTKFVLPPDTYDVELGFIQTEDCEEGLRIFNVYINDNKREEALDIFKTSGCFKALVIRYNNQIVDPISSDGIKLSFETVSGTATLSYIRIQKSKKPCVPDVPQSVSSTSNEDHFAHSVPGTYPEGGDPSYVDRLGLGYYKVKIDGSGSHTHFSANGYTARLKSYVWTREDTGKVISNRAKFSYNFPLGSTVLRLKVTDTICSEHEETTSITVTGRIQNGVVCYMYNDPGSILSGNSIKQMPRPVFSFVSKSLNVKFPTNLFKNKKFAARCIFLIMFPKVSTDSKVLVTTSSSGMAHLYRGPDRVFDTSSSEADATIGTSNGLEEFEVTYHYTNLAKSPGLSVKVNGKVPPKVSYDHATTLPVITSITPNSGSIAGGTQVRISGYNLHRPLAVFFGNKKASIQNRQPKSTEVISFAPPKGADDTVNVKVRTGPGYFSNELEYSYGDTCDDVKFDKVLLKEKSGKKVVVNQPTAVTLGHDGNLYVATLEGQIHKITYDHTSATVQSMCYSEKFRDSKWKNKAGKVSPRAFLGIALDPRDISPRPYVSASTLFYHRRDVSISPSNPTAWSNGAIERFKPSSAATKKKDPKQCLEHDKNIVQGIPVANGDHSVNQVVFSQSGDLLIAVGGRTNMGLPNYRLGGSWETYFSGAILVAKLSKFNFKGTIPYTTPNNLRTARPEGGYNDVDLYATGFRNLFAMTMTRNGNIYAGDNGPNKGFGDASSKCSEYNEADAAKGPTVKNIPGGGAILGTGDSKYTASRPDKIMWVRKGKYYGHPNLQRSAILGTDECAYIDPLTGKTPPPANKLPPSNYDHRIAVLRSPITGIIEYGGNEFCGKTRGTLIISKLKSQGTYGLNLNSNGKASGNPYLFSKIGGLSVVEDSTGSLIFPKYFSDPENGFVILKPHVSNRSQLYISGAVPFRHGKKGGTNLHISGRGFSTSSIVTIGGKTCQPVSRSVNNIVCKVPKYTSGPLSVDVTVKSGSSSTTLKKAILYMEV